jgi:hypothetical protein
MRMTSMMTCAFMSACAEDAVVEIGLLEVQGAGQQVQVPLDAVVNEPFRVELKTWGDGCFSLERTDVETTVDEVQITPFDRRKLGSGCPTILNGFDHGQTIMFDSSGNKTVRIVGRREVGNMDEMLELTFPVTVN